VQINNHQQVLEFEEQPRVRWDWHALEQFADNRLIRPRARYVGKRDLRYVPIGERG